MFGKDKTIVIGADHLGNPLKNVICQYLQTKGYQVVDMSYPGDDSVDYPDVGAPLAEAVAEGRFERGILVCGTGAGMAIVANKVPGVRAVCINDPYTAERAVASNNAQVITFGSLVTGPAVAKKLIDIWLESEFQGGGSAIKVNKIDEYDKNHRSKKTNPADEIQHLEIV
jgi:ribose 5-phosphate isomerase B